MKKLIHKLVKAGRQNLNKQIIAVEEEENKDGDDARKLKLTLVKFFKENPEPNDEAIHNFAKELKLDPSELETAIYKLLGSLVNLKKGDMPDDKFDAEQLKMGVKVERKEHTDDPDIAKAISKAHLDEIPDYYTRLLKMEKEAGVKE